MRSLANPPKEAMIKLNNVVKNNNLETLEIDHRHITKWEAFTQENLLNLSRNRETGTTAMPIPHCMVLKIYLGGQLHCPAGGADFIRSWTCKIPCPGTLSKTILLLRTIWESQQQSLPEIMILNTTQKINRKIQEMRWPLIPSDLKDHVNVQGCSDPEKTEEGLS